MLKAETSVPTRNDDLLVIGRHNSLMRQFLKFPHRQFCLHSMLVEQPVERLPGLVVVELPRLRRKCTAKYRAVEELITTFDQSKTDLVVFMQIPIQARKVPSELLEKGGLRVTRHCYCRYINAACHTKLTLLSAGPIADTYQQPVVQCY